MKKVAIVILNWNGWRNTVECLQTLEDLQLTTYNLQLIVVDNGSVDESVKNIKKFASQSSSGAQISKIKNTNQISKIKLIENKKNLGFAEGNNVGIRDALSWGADYVILLNNDTLVDKNLLRGLVEVAEKDKKIGVVGPKIYFAPGFEFYKNRYQKQERGRVIWYAGGIIDWQNVYCFHRGVDEVDRGQYEREEKTDFVSGCCMLIKKEVFEKIGFLDKRYFLYLEDVDFCLRAKRAGFKIVYTPKGYLWHKNAASSEKPGSKIHQYYQTRNRLYFGFKYAPLRAKLALFRESIKFLLKNGIRQKAVSDFYLGRMGEGKLNG